MTTLIPQIPSAALPRTPVEEWADGLHGTLDSHHTKTPVDNPGPKVPGGWTDDQEPLPANPPNLREMLPTQDDVKRALESAKSYLPQGVASYLPSGSSDSTAVDVGHGASVPYTESGAEPYAQGVELGPASTTYTKSGAEPYGAGAGSDLGNSGIAGGSAAAATLVAGLTTAAEAAKQYIPESVAAYLPGSTSTSTAPSNDVSLHPASTTYTPAGPAPYGSAAGASSDLGSAAAVTDRAASNDVSLHPASTNYTQAGPAPYGSTASSDLGSAAAATDRTDSNTATLGHTPHPDATPGILPSHPGAAVSSAHPPHAFTHPVHPPTPTQFTESPAPMTRGESVGGESGYVAETEPEMEIVPPPQFTKTGSAAFNSNRLEDNVPTGDPDWQQRLAELHLSDGEGVRAPRTTSVEEMPSGVGLSGANGPGPVGTSKFGEGVHPHPHQPPVVAEEAEEGDGEAADVEEDEQDDSGDHVEGEGKKKKGRFMNKVKKVLGKA